MTAPENWANQYLGYRFSDPGLLTQALTHKSRSENNNERLEFLGDAVLGLVIAEALYQVESIADEGALSRLRASLVRRETLAEIAVEMSLGDRLLLGSGEARSGGHHRQSIMADALEALIGAVFLDGGFDRCRDTVLAIYRSRLEDLPDVEAVKDPKTQLQERLQADGYAVPVYEVLGESGPPHARRFEVSCSVSELQLQATASGSSRRRAEQMAAARAIEQLEGLG